MQRSASAARKRDANGKTGRPSSDTQAQATPVQGKQAQAVKAQATKEPAARRRTKAAATTRESPVAAHALPQRHVLVREAAYFLAERRGFAPGRELDDWVHAEAEIERLLAAQR